MVCMGLYCMLYFHVTECRGAASLYSPPEPLVHISQVAQQADDKFSKRRAVSIFLNVFRSAPPFTLTQTFFSLIRLHVRRPCNASILNGSAEEKSGCLRGSRGMSREQGRKQSKKLRHGLSIVYVLHILLRMMPPERPACNPRIVKDVRGPIFQAFVSAHSC